MSETKPYEPEMMWDLDTRDRIKNLTGWWWWWIFMWPDGKDRKRTRQLMILWSTKNCKKILVDDYNWERNKDITRKELKSGARSLLCDGMTAAWYFDGKKMHDPLLLTRSDMESRWNGPKGRLSPKLPGGERYEFSGEPGDYRVAIHHKGDSFDFKMSPWTKFMGEHRFTEGRYVGKMGYNILKVYGSKLKGDVDFRGTKENIEGTAYFQKVMVNAPATPWYWAMFHSQSGAYLDYMMPHFGMPCWRKQPTPKSGYDRGYFFLSRNIHFYDPDEDVFHEFHKKKGHKITITKAIKDGLPTFKIHGEDRKGDREIDFTLKAYSRAYWRFEQKYWAVMRSVLFYNEYPSTMESFRFRSGGRKVRLEDLGEWTRGNTEHAWGWLA